MKNIKKTIKPLKLVNPCEGIWEIKNVPTNAEGFRFFEGDLYLILLNGDDDYFQESEEYLATLDPSKSDAWFWNKKSA